MELTNYVWTPGHSVVQATEVADRLTKEAEMEAKELGFSFFQRRYRLYSAQWCSSQMVNFKLSSSVIILSGMFLIIIY